MKQLLNVLRSARKIEILVVIAMLCVLLVLSYGERGGGGAQPDSEEMRLKQILTQIEGAGRVSVMISRNQDDEIQGVVVAASGADDLRVMLEMQRAVKTLTNLELERIEILESKR